MAALTKMIKKAAKRPAKRTKPVYERILLKLSGESLQGPQGFGIHGESIQAIARELKEVHALGVEIAIMVGGGNIYRGAERHRDAPGFRAVYPAARDAAPREETRGDFCRGNREPVLLDRHSRSLARHGDQGRRDPEGHARGRNL